MRYLLFAFLTLTLACKEPSEILIDEYYNLNSFWENQIESLNEGKPKFQKVINMNGDKSEMSTSEIDWKKELEIFMSTDINRSAMKGSYNEVRTEDQIHYTLKEDREQPVRSITISLKNNQPAKVSAKILTENFLYNSARDISATFENGELSSFEVDGWQELFIGSKKTFDISAIRVN